MSRLRHLTTGACQECRAPADSGDISEKSTTQPTVESFLTEQLRVGDPQSARHLTLFLLFGPEPRCRYLGYAQAQQEGVAIGELPGGASVNDLLVENPTGERILLFEGEEVLGAQQNRTFDVSVLVKERTTLKVPVSCVEAGRWDGSRHHDSFDSAPQAANPRVRRLKAEDARQQVVAGRQARADQGAVWQEVGAMAIDHGVASPTAASHDIFEARRSALDEICRSLSLQPGQLGSIAAIKGGAMCVLDLVSRPDVYASLQPRLTQGYALDALGAPATSDGAAELATARGFALLASDADIEHRGPGVGLGEEIRFSSGGVAGSGLIHEGELIQLTVFLGSDAGESHQDSIRGGRVRRPSRRGRPG